VRSREQLSLHVLLSLTDTVDRRPTMHFAYIVRCADGSLYAGYARDPHAREAAHNNGRGARYTSGRRPVRLVYSEAFEDKGGALRRECQIKRLTRRQKEALLT